MNRKFEISNIFWGAIGAVLLCVSPNGFGMLPAIGVAITSLFLIRRNTEENEISESEKRSRLIRNIISVICWAVAAVVCYFITDKFKNDGLWFILASYIFLVIHGVLFLVNNK